MFENEDVILPDDYQAQPEAEEITEPTETLETTVDSEWDTNTTEETEEVETQEETPQINEPQKIKIKFNHEEQEIPVDEAAPLIQKGMNFDKAVERAKQEARDAVIAEQGYAWNGKPITTEAEYKEALQEQEWMQKYQNQDLPEEVVQELIEGRKFREQLQSESKEKQEKEKADADFNDFFQYYKQANGREFNASKDPIPKEVWDIVGQGVPLKFAYMEHRSNELQSQVKVLKQNKENEQKAPIGSVTAHGSTEVVVEDDFLRGFNSI